jgi:hypothetical protein
MEKCVRMNAKLTRVPNHARSRATAWSGVADPTPTMAHTIQMETSQQGCHEDYVLRLLRWEQVDKARPAHRSFKKKLTQQTTKYPRDSPRGAEVRRDPAFHTGVALRGRVFALTW